MAAYIRSCSAFLGMLDGNLRLPSPSFTMMVTSFKTQLPWNPSVPLRLVESTSKHAVSEITCGLVLDGDRRSPWKVLRGPLVSSASLRYAEHKQSDDLLYKGWRSNFLRSATRTWTSASRTYLKQVRRFYSIRLRRTLPAFRRQREKGICHKHCGGIEVAWVKCTSPR